MVCPFAVLRSRFGLRYSRVRGRQQSKFLASSSAGGARNFYPYTGEPRSALRKATVMRAKILSVTPLNPLGVTAPLINKGSQENCVNAIPWSRIQPLSHRWFLIKGIKALVCPFAVLRSRFGLRYSRVRGRRQSKFLASSSAGGARNFYPVQGEPRSVRIILLFPAYFIAGGVFYEH